MMSFLVDKQIKLLLTAQNPIATHIAPNDATKIQAASLDLSIGDIFLPGASADKPGCAAMPKEYHSLATGQTAVIRTKETLALPDSLAGLGFPPAHLSLRGLLMTNPGHIDPGYQGPLHLTVINMSSEPFSLRRGDRIIRVLFGTLSETPDADYRARHTNSSTDNPITHELLSNLSSDFINVTDRATKIASDKVSNANLIGVGVPIFVAIIVGLFGLYNKADTKAVEDLRDRVVALEEKAKVEKGTSTLQTKAEAAVLAKRIGALEEQLKSLLGGKQK